MRGISKYKVPGGKLLEIRLDYDESIKKAEILGDFFLYPEESISDIEKSLIGIKTGESEKAIAEKIRKLVNSKKIEMIGIDPESISKAVKMAVVE